MGLLDDAIREHLDLKRRRGADPTEVEREEREVLGPVRRRGDPEPDEEFTQVHVPEDDLEHEPLPEDGEASDDWHDEAAAEAEPASPPAAFNHEDIAPLSPDPPARYTEAERGLYAAPEPEPYTAPEPDPYVAPDPGSHLAPEPYATPEPVAPESGSHVAPEPDAAPPEPAPIAPDPYAAREPDPAPPEPAPPEPPAAREPHPATEPYRADPGHEPPPEEQTAEFNVQDHLEEEHPPHAPGEVEEDVLEETPEFLQDTPDHDRLWFEQRPPRDFDFDG